MFNKLLAYILMFPVYFFIVYVLDKINKNSEDRRTIPEIVMIAIAYSISTLVCNPGILLLVTNITLGLVTDLYFIPKMRREKNTGVA